MRKEAYEKVELDIYSFKTEDVIATSSSDFIPDNNEGTPVSG